MRLRSVLLCAMLLLGFLSSQTESRKVCKDHSRHCRQIGTKRPLHRCYRKGTSQQCCATCRQKEDPNNPDCAYGDRLAWCSSIGNRYSVVSCYTHHVECCGTCSRLAKREIPDCPYGDREIWCAYFTRTKCLDGDTSACCQTCYHLLHGDTAETHGNAGTDRSGKTTSNSIQTLPSVTGPPKTTTPTTTTVPTTTPTASTLTSTTSTVHVTKNKQMLANGKVSTKLPTPQSQSQTSSTAVVVEEFSPVTVQYKNNSVPTTSTVLPPPVVSIQNVTSSQAGTRARTGNVTSPQTGTRTRIGNVTSSQTGTRTRTGDPMDTSYSDVRNMSTSPATVTYKEGPVLRSVSLSSTLSTLSATEIHIKLQGTSTKSANMTKARNSLYHSSLTDDEDYAQASGEGDDDITIDDVTDERGHGGHHHDREHGHHEGNGGHHGGHHHKKGHHHGNGVTQEVPYHYVQGADRDYIFDDFRSAGVRLMTGMSSWMFVLLLTLTIANQHTDGWST